MLDRDAFLAALDRTDSATVAAASLAERGETNYTNLQGETTMNVGNGQPRALNRRNGPAAMSGHEVTLAHGDPGGCACGAPGGVCACAGGESSSSRFIYVLGSVDIRFPDQSISDELQAVATTLSIQQGADEPLRNWYHRVLSKSEARYVARQLSWILKVEGQPAYYLALRDLHDLPDLISCLGDLEDDLDLFVGLSSLIPVDTCPGVTAPVLAVDQLCSFERDDLIAWFKTPSNTSPKKRTPGPNEHDLELFKKLVESADNFGDTDEWRALNYLAIRYQPLYERYAEMVEKGYTLDSVKVATSRLGRERRIVDPIFAFRHKESGVVDKYFVRVDVSHLFPMIVYHIAEYFDR
jgi:hypothetical protein